MVQRDLFETNLRTTAGTDSLHKRSFLDRYHIQLRIDQLLMMMIGLLVILALTYGLGVEKGKQIQTHTVERLEKIKKIDKAIELPVGSLNPASNRDSETNLFSSTESASSSGNLATSLQNSSASETIENRSSSFSQSLTASPSEKTMASVPKGGYTIQLITFLAKEPAHQEIDKLSKKGLEGFIIPKGKYLHVCVNRFASVKQANIALTTFKSQGIVPRDAYVRNIPQ